MATLGSKVMYMTYSMYIDGNSKEIEKEKENIKIKARYIVRTTRCQNQILQ